MITPNQFGFLVHHTCTRNNVSKLSTLNGNPNSSEDMKTYSEGHPKIPSDACYMCGDEAFMYCAHQVVKEIDCMNDCVVPFAMGGTLPKLFVFTLPKLFVFMFSILFLGGCEMMQNGKCDDGGCDHIIPSLECYMCVVEAHVYCFGSDYDMHSHTDHHGDTLCSTEI